MSPATGPRPATGRGQTLPDFVVGIAVFLVTVTLLVQFVPQLILPYQDQEQPVVAQRVASDLRNGLLANETPSELNETCTLAFFDGSGGTGCPFDPGDPLTERLGVDPTYSVNVTLRTAPSDDPDSAFLCDGGDVGACQPGETPLALGPPLPEAERSVAVSRERVFVGDTGAVLEVGVW